MKQTPKRIVLATAFLLLIAMGVMMFVQPLLPSRAYTRTATHQGRPIRAELLHPPFMPGLYYVRLAEVQDRRYLLFGVAFQHQSVFEPGSYYSTWLWLRYIHTSKAKGVRLTNLMEDEWNVAFASDGVQFSNATLSITLKRNP